MSEKIEQDGTVALDGLDGQRLLEDARSARQQRAHQRSLRGRAAALRERAAGLLGDRPAWLKGVMIAAAATVALLVALVLVDVAASAGRVHPGVRVGEVRVGAMTPEKAAAAVEEHLAPRLADPLTLTFEERSWELGAGAVEATLDAEELVSEAMTIGRTGGVRERVATRMRLWFEPKTVPVAVEADEALLDGFLATVAEEVDRAPTSAAVVIEGTDARLEPAVLGIGVRQAEAAERILTAFVATDRQVAVPVDFLPVAITDEGARKALEDAQAMLAGPVAVTHGDRAWRFEAVDIASWIAFREIPDPTGSTATTPTPAAAATGAAEPVAPAGEPTATAEPERLWLEAYISAEEASSTIIRTVGEAGSPPVDARFSVSGGTVTIVPSQDGVGPDVEAMAVEMTRVLTSGEGEREVQLRTQRIEPELTTEGAQKMGIKERIATYTTNFSSANRPRVSNIHTLATALDGTLVPPGGTFSFNETIGPRTAAKGYQEAPAIIGGRLVPSLGGGICQVATTLFNTVFESGLPVVERRNHSFYISTYPKGRDATVSWGGVDFKFRNDTDAWVLIATSFSNTSVTVSLYGTDPGYQVTGTTGEFTDVRPHGVKEIEDDTLAAGMRVVEDSGSDGRRISVKRVVRKGGTVIREDTFNSTYQPKEETVRVGTMQPAPVTDPPAVPAAP